MPKTTEVDIQIETIDAETAKRYLATTEKNRHVTQFSLSKLVRDMKNGKWAFNGDPIRFSKGKLIDGQHRLNAIILSGKSQTFVVMRELPAEAFDTIDTGRTRTTVDYIGMEGHRYPQAIAAAARWYLNYKMFHNVGSKEPMTNQDRLQILRDVPDIVKYAQGYATHRDLRMSPAMLAALHVLFREKAKAAADEFMEAIMTGLDIKSGDPRYTARQWIIRRPRTTRGVYNSFTVQAAYILIRAWNAWRAGETRTAFDPVKEFPIIK